MRIMSRLICSFLLVGASACGGSDPVTPPPPPPACPANTICMTGALFYTTPATTPTSLTAAVNAPVAWLNGSGVVHNVTFGNPSAALQVGTGGSGNITEHSSGTNSRQFNATGTQTFQCTLHNGMTGSVVVQ